MTTRRDFLKSVGVIASGLVVPTWLAKPKRVIDLTPFCAAGGQRYDMSAPFIQGEADSLYMFGTDRYVCIRTAATPFDCATERLKLPPAIGLDWSHDSKRGWRTLPRADYLMAKYSDCPHCDGRGAPASTPECGLCEGDPGSNEYGYGCHECEGTGFDGPVCIACRGSGFGTFPGVQRLTVGAREFFIDSRKHAKIVEHLGECEFRLPDRDTTDDLICKSNLMLRGDGWEGLLCPLNTHSAKERIRV